MVYKFTKSGEKVLEIANELATDMGHSYIGTEHILYGLSCEENGVASKVLEKQGITPEEILDKIEERKEAKKNKDFALADAIRDELLEKGIKLIDSREGTTYEVI